MDNRMREGIVADILKAQMEGEPLKVYRKAIVGKTIVRVLDQFLGHPSEMVLHGIPGRVDSSEIEVSLWTPVEVKYFERMNKGLIENGSLVRVSDKTDFELNMVNALDDQALSELVHAPFFKMKKVMDNITSETTLQRLLKVAEEENRPATTLNNIRERLEEVQQS